MNEHHQRRPERRPSLFGPLLLIAAGILFLANNLGVIPGDFWDVVLQMWPLILVLAGLDSIIRGEGLVWPLILVLFGMFLTMRNFELIVLQNWDRLWRLWPLILVAIGVDLILKEHTPWRSVVGVVMLVVLVGAGFWLVGIAGEGTFDEALLVEEDYTGELDRAVFDISQAAGDLIVEEGTAQGQLLSGSLNPPPERREYVETGGIGYYTLKSDSPMVFPARGVWELAVTTGLPLAFEIDQGAGQIEIGLEENQVQRIAIEQGVGTVELAVAGDNLDELTVDQAIGKILIYVPERASVRLMTERALSTLDLPDGFVDQGEYYEKAGTAAGDEQILITLSQAIGKIELRYR
jgi:hypothetical protein